MVAECGFMGVHAGNRDEIRLTDKVLHVFEQKQYLIVR
jgi:hypothetical protein